MRGKLLHFTAVCVAASALAQTAIAGPQTAAPKLSSRSVPIITVDDRRFRDLDRDGRLAPFEDWRRTPHDRALDLLARLTLEEKAGLMMHSTLAGIGNALGASSEGYDLAAVAREVADRKITTFITRLGVSPRRMAEENDKVQAIAERGRFAIPVTISTDPRHHFQHVLGASVSGQGYSQWPETLGFAALGDPALVRRFADTARQEFRATGVHEILGPQADLFTEPRWSRGTGTFGADPALARDLVAAFVEGFQGGAEGVTPDGVMAVVKHWVGYGASPRGWDGHNYYGRFAQLDNTSLPLHIEPFKGAFAAHVGGVMPTYDIMRGVEIDGKPLEQVGAGFNAVLLRDLLREKYGFRGIILSDWAITLDCPQACMAPETPQPPSTIGMPWGVEALTPRQRYVKAINAGIDQIGGASEPALIVAAARQGEIDPARIDSAALQVLEVKFAQGLFENPFVDPDAAARTVGTPDVLAYAARVQAQAQVLVRNEGHALPLKPGTKVWLHQIDKDAAQRAGLVVVERPEQAEFALVRASTPFEQEHPLYFFGARQHEGRLDYRPGNADFDLVRSLRGKTRVILAPFTDRPAVMTAIAPLTDAILVNFGVGDNALLAALTGREKAKGRLPFELPRSEAAVDAQNPAMPDDSGNPLFPRGFAVPY